MRLRRLLIPLCLFAAAAVVIGVRSTDDQAAKPRYEPGQCTAWAYAKRPDLTAGTKGLAAADWENWARRHGYRVDTTPQPGDIAVWDRNIGAGPDGHVAFVDSVTRAGAVYVTERNTDGCREVAFTRLTLERLSTALFIHRRTAGTLR